MIEVIDLAVEGFLSRYDNDIMAAQGAFLHLLDSPSFGSQRDMSQLIYQTQYKTQTFGYREMFEGVTHQAERLMTLAFDGKVPPQTLTENVSLELGMLAEKLHTQKRADVQEFANHYRKIAHRANIVARTNGWSKRASVVASKEQLGLPARFTSLDRSGKRWGSRNYVKAHLRHTLLTIYNESKLFALSLDGRKTATIIHQDPSNKINKKTIRIVPNGRDTSYDDVKGKVFHPNSRAVIA